jgi:hypothetical protein
VLFIGTQFSILYTSMYSPTEAATVTNYGYATNKHRRILKSEIDYAIVAESSIF